MIEQVNNLRQWREDLLSNPGKKTRFLELEKNQDIREYELDIKLSLISSSGNCDEFTKQAFDFILYHDNSIKAEVYEIQGGDHVFLVLNRDPNSDPSDPDTWGKKAVICDPWANSVYYALNFRHHLKNFYYGFNNSDYYYIRSCLQFAVIN